MGIVNNVFWTKAINTFFFVVVVKTATMDDKGGQKSEGKPKKEMDIEAAARIQSAEAKKNDGKVEKGTVAVLFLLLKIRKLNERQSKPQYSNKSYTRSLASCHLTGQTKYLLRLSR